MFQQPGNFIPNRENLISKKRNIKNRKMMVAEIKQAEAAAYSAVQERPFTRVPGYFKIKDRDHIDEEVFDEETSV